LNPPFVGRGDLGGCRALSDLEEVMELDHRSSTGYSDLELVIIGIMFGSLKVGIMGPWPLGC
jgi:hypothetical protein